MYYSTDDLRIAGLRPLIPPAILIEEIPVSPAASETVAFTRRAAERVISGEDDRIIVVVGPCSIHDPKAALEYAARLREARDRLSDDLVVIMRVYFEKPRTTVGWKGLINDPDLDGSFSINKGLRVARGLLRDIAELDLASATEFLDTISPQFIADFISWGAIGARTTESQVHRELASGLSCPVGFKNSTEGDVQIAVDAVRAAREAHHFLSVTKQGISAIVATRGNPACHVILRGSQRGPNYAPEHVRDAAERLTKAGLPHRLMVDCSHGNSQKDPARQRIVAESLADQLRSGSRDLLGVMIESHLVGGRQDLAPGKLPTYGQSITDACLGWNDTLPVLELLAQGVRDRRASKAA
ncbi:3-deoxy-7-phosphoheptulonate synthase [Sorangium sp. So ce1014]|uniref:3-deoxy-7-phosphoheptulonate synthase n=1 Tax=Sorangium sp. So ce1014 TaxID=3133326 RepID=UPI003F63FC40